MRGEEHRKVEAVLFAVGRDIAVEEVARLCHLTEGQTQQVLGELRADYNDGLNALALVEKGRFWKFSVKDRYLPLVTNLVQNTELDKSVMETLAVIAWKYPILQAQLIKIRHNKAYEHLKMLQEREFISKEKSGRTFKIKLTPKFFEYFDLPSQDAKEMFKKVISQDIQQEIAHAEEEIAAKEKGLENAKKSVSVPPEKKNDEQLAKKATDEMDSEGQ